MTPADQQLGGSWWILCRADGEPIDGDVIDFYDAGTDDEPDWVTDNHDYTVETAIIAWRVQVVDTRVKTYSTPAEDTDDN